MGFNEYRAPNTLGGVSPAWIYRDDLRWLVKKAHEASRWLSRKGGSPVRVDAADILHQLVEAQRVQGDLPLPPQGPPWPIFWRPRPRKPRQRPIVLPVAALIALAGCGGDGDNDSGSDSFGPACVMHWISDGYAGPGDVLEIVTTGIWSSEPSPECEEWPGEIYSASLLKLSGSEPRNVRLVGPAPFPESGRIRVIEGTCGGANCGGTVIVGD